MSNASALFRSLIVYGLALPLAVCLGYLLATPVDFTTITAVSIILAILAIPVLLRWHHVWLIASWNMAAVVFVLPGRPPIWLCMAAISFVIGVLQYTLNRNNRFLSAPAVVPPLLFLAAVVIITARLTGGIGLKAFGSSVFGGKYYVYILGAIIGYFALISRPIPPHRGVLYVSIFFLGGATIALGELPRILPSSFNFLYLVFPVMRGNITDSTDVFGSSGFTERITGLGWLGSGLFAFLLARYGLRGILLTPGKPWRPVLLAACMLAGLMGGFRSILIIYIMTIAVLFYLERLYRTRLLPFLVIGIFCAGTLVVVFAERMPFAVQRSMAFLPVNIDPVARLNAEASSEWRLQIWRNLLPQVPQYLILGKGYGFSGRELASILQTSRSDQESTEMVGDYHNGPLSIIIPFGIFGVIGFVWFLWAGAKVTYHNYLFGDPSYQHLNCFIFASFVVKVIFFFAIFGAFPNDIGALAGLVGLSVSLNGGVAKPVVVQQPKVVFNRFRLHPSVRRPIGA
jgi:hypothetical protein